MGFFSPHGIFKENDVHEALSSVRTSQAYTMSVPQNTLHVREPPAAPAHPLQGQGRRIPSTPSTRGAPTVGITLRELSPYS